MSGWSWQHAPEPRSMSLPAAIQVHGRVQLARMLKLRTLWPWLAVVLAIALGGWAIVRFSVESAQHVTDYIETWGLRTVTLVALGLGTAAIRQDADAGSLAFFLLRPRAKIALPIGRWLAVTTVAAALGGACLLFLWLAAHGSSADMTVGELLRLEFAAVLAACAYGATFLAIAVWFRAAVGASVAWLVIADTLGPQSSGLATLAPSHYLAAILGRETTPDTSAFVAVAALLVWTALMLVASVVRLQRQPPMTQQT